MAQKVSLLPGVPPAKPSAVRLSAAPFDTVMCRLSLWLRCCSPLSARTCTTLRKKTWAKRRPCMCRSGCVSMYTSCTLILRALYITHKKNSPKRTHTHLCTLTHTHSHTHTHTHTQTHKHTHIHTHTHAHTHTQTHTHTHIHTHKHTHTHTQTHTHIHTLTHTNLERLYSLVCTHLFHKCLTLKACSWITHWNHSQMIESLLWTHWIHSQMNG